MRDFLNERDSAGGKERAVATPILAALSRQVALRVPFGFALLQRSPPPVLVPAMQCKSITEVIRAHIKSAIRKAKRMKATAAPQVVREAGESKADPQAKTVGPDMPSSTLTWFW